MSGSLICKCEKDYNAGILVILERERETRVGQVIPSQLELEVDRLVLSPCFGMAAEL